MNFELSESQVMIQHMVRDFAQKEIAPLAAHYDEAGEPKGEIVIVISPPDADGETISAEALDAKLAEALKGLSVKDAADAVAAETGMKRRAIYQRALALAGQRDKSG